MRKLPTFEEFLKQKHQEEKNQRGEILKNEERKNKWLKEVDLLYTQIQNWFLPFSDTIKFSLVGFTVQESLLGTYNMKALIIRIGPDEVILEPQGTYMLGGFGRIDIKGQYEYILSLSELDEGKAVEDKWQIVDKLDRMQREKLSKENFEQLLQKLAR